MKKLICVSLILFLGWNFSINLIAQITVNLESTADTYLRQSQATINYGGTATVSQSPNTSSRHNSLYLWDLSGIPNDVTITAASLTFNVTDASAYDFSLFSMRRSWTEGTNDGAAGSGASWNFYGAGTGSWGTAGAQNTTSDRYNTDLWDATATTFGTTGSVTIPLNSNGVTVIQEWITSLSANYGLTIQFTGTGSSTDYWIVSSSEATITANRPKLNVTYTVLTSEPTITTNGTLTPFNSQPGVPSEVQSFTVSGSNLTESISIISPPGFEISLSSTSGFGSSLTLAQSDGTVPTSTIYVRLNQATEGTPGGNITHSSAGANQKDIAVSGVVSSSVTISLVPSADTYLSGVNTTNNYGASTTLKSTLDADNQRGALFSWDLSSIPPNATVTSVSLTLYISTSASQTYNLYNMRRSWVEGTGSGSTSGDGATWQTSNGTTSWGTNGASNITSDRFDVNLWGAGTSSFSSTGSKTVTFNTEGLAVVQGWIAGSINNYGLTMQNYSTSTSINDDLQFASSENTTVANRPKLNITYSTSTSPVINTTGTLTAFTTVPGSPSSEQNYSVSGTNLTDDILISAPSDFEISKTSGSGFSSSLTLSQSGGSVAATIIYVRFFRATTGTTTGNITHTSLGATTKNKAVSGTASSQSATWTAYNDGAYIDGQISTNITTYVGYTNNTSGLLKKYVDGSNTPVNVLVTTSGTIASQISSDQSGSETNTGTDAYNTFHGFVNMVGGMRLGTSASYIDLTFTGLDQTKTYAFATTANRNNSGSDYITRITKFTISDLDEAINASSSGVTVNNNLSVSFSTGYNTENGYVARWTDIQSGTDGDFKVRFEVNSGDYAYGPAVFMLQEETGEIPVQYTLTIGNDGHGSVSLSPAGGIYNEGTPVTLTPVPGSGYEFSTWSGTNGDDPTDNSNGTWVIIMDANKSISANFSLQTGNVAPNQPVLVQPLDNAIDISKPPVLQVTVSDPNPTDNLDVSFYGRATSTSSGEDFTIVVIPDPQNQATSYPAVYNSQTQWISDNKLASNIVFATSVGDLVNTSSSSTEYGRADAAFDILDAGNVQYSVSPGNHDMSMGTTLWPTYFGASRFSGKSWYGGSLDDYNSYSLFSASGMDFIIINLQYSPGTTQLNWADALLKSNSGRRAIIVQHDILNINNSWANQASYTALKDNPNLFLMLCGHMHSASDGAAYRAEPGDDGHTIHIVMADYQDYPNGGNAYIRILRFSPSDDIIYMTTYSPYSDASITTSPDQMNITYDLANGSPSAYSLIGSVNDIANGASATISWTGLENYTEYEWYTTVSDRVENVTGSVWSFTTASEAASQVAVSAPNGGENWQTGSNHNITWTSTGITGNVHIEYSTNNGSNWTDVIASIANNGSYAWIIPNTVSVNCIVRVSDLDGTPSDVSDAVFVISQIPAIELLSPNGGEDWKIGSTRNITWTSSGTSGNVHIEYSTNNGTGWTDITASTPDDGAYSWTIPDAPSVNCIVRLSDTDGTPSDNCNAVFTISSEFTRHFNPVWTDNGFDHMNFYTLTATLDGVDLQPGDEIGIFDGDYCVGSGKLTQVLNGVNYLEIRVSRDDHSTPETEGYTAGHNATFKIWDASRHNEISGVQITYETASNNIFEIGASSWYHITGTSSVTQEITLSNGWSIFSLYVTPENTDMQEIVKPLIDAGNLVKVQNESGAAIEKIPGTSTWINNIGNWSNTEGYKIRVSSLSSLTVSGIPISDPVDISLLSGWNIIGYPVSVSGDAMQILNNLILSGILVKVQDQAGNAIEQIPNTTNWINNIGNLDPGEGYKVRVSGNGSLTITPTGSGKKGEYNSAKTNVATEYYKPLWIGNGLDQMNFYFAEIQDGEAGLEPGDEIGIFDGPYCVGSAVIREAGEKFYSFVASADDPTTPETDGFIKGHSPSFKVWRPSNNSEISIGSFEYFPGSSKVFEPMGTAAISLNTSELGLNNDFDIETSLGGNYPNPFTDETTIPFVIGRETTVDIAIYDIQGVKVCTLVHGNYPAGSYQTTWNTALINNNGISSGVYYCKMVAGKKVFIKTIILR